MKAKVTEFLNTPWTFGTYLKLCGIVTAVYALIASATWVWVKIQWKKITKDLEDQEGATTKKSGRYPWQMNYAEVGRKG